MAGVLPSSSSSHLLTFPTAVPQAGAGAGSEDSPRGVSARRFLRDVESGSLAPKAMDASLPGLRQEHRWPWGRWDLLGWVAAASFQWSLANISYLVSEVNNA